MLYTASISYIVFGYLRRSIFRLLCTRVPYVVQVTGMQIEVVFIRHKTALFYIIRNVHLLLIELDFKR